MTTVVPGQSGESVLAGRQPRVLVVEDQPQLLRALRINLRARQYEVLTAAAGREALAAAAASPPDVVILDLGLPDIDGVSVITAFRAWSRAPIIVLSGRTSPGDKIGALDAGADDYVTKPFEMAELLARLRAALRRDDAATTAPSVATVGRWTIDLAAHTVFPADTVFPANAEGSGVVVPPREPGDSAEPMRLTPTEWQILEILLRRPGQLVGSAQLLTGVWGPGFQDRTNYLRFHMARLRRKLEDDPARPRHLLTEPGMGYRYQP
ncbi:MAG TPA: response regulator [Trebonia sp.]|jgi:two-component system KDP operon response regulator KdpE|nr:response regulator [Trebonia sp.]